MMNQESKRLKYKSLSFEQLEDIYLQFSDEEMCQFFSDPPCTMEEAKEIIAHYSSNAANSYFRAAMFEKSTEAFIGTIGYHFLDLENKQVEIGYDVWKTYWGKGYASESIEMLLKDCFNELQINQIYALVHPDNMPSISILKKYHFKECEPCRPFDVQPQICLKLVRTDWENSLC